MLAVGSFGEPMVQGQREVRAEWSLDPSGDNGSPQHGVLLGIGYFLAHGLAVGVYGSTYEMDRKYPVNMSRMWGLGTYAEYTWDHDLGRIPIPYLGCRIGLLDDHVTLLHVSGYAGLKFAINERWQLSCAGVLHWGDEAIFNYEAADADHIQLDDTNITLDLGIRYLF